MIGIIDYGVGNLRSVQKSLEAVGAEAVISGDYELLKTCSHIILPGVGAFGHAMNQLKATGLDVKIKSLIEDGKYLLGICLGMQLLLTESEEGGLHRGLDIISGRVERFKISEKIPHMGWNEIKNREDEIFSKDRNTVYFVHSYHCCVAEEDILSTTEYGVEFVSAIKRGRVYGFQFHPEKSGDEGLEMLGNFVRLGGK